LWKRVRGRTDKGTIRKVQVKFLYFTDSHLRLSRPTSRIDEDFLELEFNKLREVFAIAEKESVTFILFGGDLFDRVKPEFKLVNAVVAIFKKNIIPFYAVAGNHDLVGYQLKTIENTAFWNLVEAGLITYISEEEDNIFGLKVKGIPFSSTHDFNYVFEKPYDVVISHNMIVPTVVPFSHMTVQNIKSNVPLILCGHYHSSFTAKVGETKVINPGALLRMDAIESEIQRSPQVLIVDTLANKFKFVKLTCAQEGIKVFDMAKIQTVAESYSRFFSSLDSVKMRSFVISDVIKQLGIELGQDAINEALKRIGEAETNYA